MVILRQERVFSYAGRVGPYFKYNPNFLGKIRGMLDDYRL
jgi:hypothetical protein